MAESNRFHIRVINQNARPLSVRILENLNDISQKETNSTLALSSLSAISVLSNYLGGWETLPIAEGFFQLDQFVSYLRAHSRPVVFVWMALVYQ